jgi:anti-sigma factor RsiW
MLHAYELGILEEDDQREFEAHLLVCDQCFERVQAFLPTAALLRHAPEVEAIAREAVRQGETGKQSSRSFFRSIISIPAVRYAAMAAILLAVAVPLVRYNVFDAAPEQQIFLSPVRSSEDAVIDLSVGGRVAITFVMPGASEATVCAVTVVSQAGDTLFSDQSLSGFNTTGQVMVELETSAFSPGVYVLSAEHCTHAADSVRQYYLLAR